MSWSVYIFLLEANMDVKLNNDFKFIKQGMLSGI